MKLAEIHEESERAIQQLQVRLQLPRVHAVQLFDRLYFHDYQIVDDEIRSESVAEKHPPEFKRGRFLSDHVEAFSGKVAARIRS